MFRERVGQANNRRFDANRKEHALSTGRLNGLTQKKGRATALGRGLTLAGLAGTTARASVGHTGGFALRRSDTSRVGSTTLEGGASAVPTGPRMASMHGAAIAKPWRNDPLQGEPERHGENNFYFGLKPANQSSPFYAMLPVKLAAGVDPFERPPRERLRSHRRRRDVSVMAASSGR
jgi:hypothetical protein